MEDCTIAYQLLTWEKCGYTVYPKPYEPDCIKLSEASEEYLNYMRK
nr:MAG TPA: hypothetical protein [Caudoviricetes sp.]